MIDRVLPSVRQNQDDPSFPQASVDAQRTQIWYTVCPVPAASSLGFARGEFAAAFAGSDVDLQNIRTHADREIREAHYRQTQPDAFREGGNIPPIWARSNGRRLRVIGLSWVEHYSAILTLPGSDIRTAKDLKGKRLSLISRPNDPVDYPRATALRGYLSALETAGLGYDDVTFVDVPIPDALVGNAPEPSALSRSAFSASIMRRWQGPELTALVRGEVDAIYASTQAVEVQSLLAAHVVTDVAALPRRVQRINNLTPIVFTVREELLERRPDIVARYLAQAIRTARWAKSSAEDARRLIARDTGLAEEWVDRAYSPDVTQVLEPGLDPELIRLLSDQKDFLLRWKFIPNDFDVDDWIAHEPLAEARRLVATSG